MVWRHAFMAVVAAATLLEGCGGGGSGGDSGPYTIGGTLSGVNYGSNAGGPKLVLLLNGGNAISHPSNGAFAFPQKLAAGASYQVTAQVSLLQPQQACTITNGSGTAGPSSSTGDGHLHHLELRHQRHGERPFRQRPGAVRRQ